MFVCPRVSTSLGSHVPVSVGHWESSLGEEMSFWLLHLCLSCFLGQNSVLNTPDPDTQGVPRVSPQVRAPCRCHIGVELSEALVLRHW